MNRFVKRNRAALNAALKEARASIKRGEGIEVQTYEEFAAAIAGGGRRGRKRKK